MLLNAECTDEVRAELENLFKFNDAVIRSMFLVRDDAVTDQSLMMKPEREERDAVTASASASRRR